MDNSEDERAIGRFLVEEDVRVVFVAANAECDPVGRTSHTGNVCQKFEGVGHCVYTAGAKMRQMF